jgi:hypothetical protein
MSTFITKLTTKWVYLPACRTGNFQFVATFITELGIFGVLKLAFLALHSIPHSIA